MKRYTIEEINRMLNPRKVPVHMFNRESPQIIEFLLSENERLRADNQSLRNGYTILVEESASDNAGVTTFEASFPGLGLKVTGCDSPWHAIYELAALAMEVEE